MKALKDIGLFLSVMFFAAAYPLILAMTMAASIEMIFLPTRHCFLAVLAMAGATGFWLWSKVELWNFIQKEIFKF